MDRHTKGRGRYHVTAPRSATDTIIFKIDFSWIYNLNDAERMWCLNINEELQLI